MKKTILTCILALFATVLVFAQQQQLTVIVAPFEVRAGFSSGEAETISELFLTELAKYNSTIRVLDQSASTLNEVSRQIGFGMSDWTNDARVVELGRALQANAVVRGQLMVLGDQRIITVRVLDLNTTQILAPSRMDIRSTAEVLEKLPSFTKEIIDNLPIRQLQIGDTGPGGGIIFFAQNGNYMECVELGSSRTWRLALSEANSYRGGGFTDWKLPTLPELTLIMDNLHKSNIREFNDHFYWSSSETGRTIRVDEGRIILKQIWCIMPTGVSVGNSEESYRDRYGSENTNFGVITIRSFRQ